jgi:hypothetical protein
MGTLTLEARCFKRHISENKSLIQALNAGPTKGTHTTNAPLSLAVTAAIVSHTCFHNGQCLRFPPSFSSSLLSYATRSRRSSSPRCGLSNTFFSHFVLSQNGLVPRSWFVSLGFHSHDALVSWFLCAIHFAVGNSLSTILDDALQSVFLSRNRELGLGFRCALGFWMTTCFAQVHIALHTPNLLYADWDWIEIIFNVWIAGPERLTNSVSFFSRIGFHCWIEVWFCRILQASEKK